MENSLASNIASLAADHGSIRTYLIIGLCTQLPGVVWGYFLMLPMFRGLAGLNSGFETKLIVGVLWLIFSICLWPISFVLAGIRLLPVLLVALGLLSSLAIGTWRYSAVFYATLLLSAALSLLVTRPKALYKSAKLGESAEAQPFGCVPPV